jgi:hypothetical protein
MATITSAQTGDWHATGTWEGGAVPANNDLVVIAHGHKVTISTDITAAITDNVTIDGNLHFADGGKMHLNGRMTVKILVMLITQLVNSLQTMEIVVLY